MTTQHIIEFGHIPEPTGTFSVDSQYAKNFGAYLVEAYLSQHVLPGTGMTRDDALVIGVARLQYLHQEARDTLNLKFLDWEFTTMLNCFQGTNYCPDEIPETADTLCEEWGVVPEEARYSEIADLDAKLRALSNVQLSALRDALYQAWHRAISEGISAREVLESLGIHLL